MGLAPSAGALLAEWGADDIDDNGDPVGYGIVSGPVRFDEAPPVLRRGPEFAERTELILIERGIDRDRIAALKESGAIA